MGSVSQLQASAALASSATPTYAFGSNVAQGDLLIAYASTATISNTLNSVTDSLGTIYSIIKNTSSGTKQEWLAVGIAPASGPNTVQWNLGAAISISAVLCDAVGFSPTTDGINTNSGGPSTTPQSGSITTTNSGDLILSFMRVGGITAGPTSFTTQFNGANGGAYWIPGATETVNPQWACASNTFIALTVAFVPGQSEFASGEVLVTGSVSPSYLQSESVSGEILITGGVSPSYQTPQSASGEILITGSVSPGYQLLEQTAGSIFITGFVAPILSPVQVAIGGLIGISGIVIPVLIFPVTPSTLPVYAQGTPYITTLRLALLTIWEKWPYRLIEDQNGNFYTARQLVNNQNLGTKALMQVMVEYSPELGTIVWVFQGVRQQVLYTVTNQDQNPFFTYL